MSPAVQAGPDVQGSVERDVLARTHGRVRDLRVELDAGKLILHGRSPSQYLKQLAQVAAMDLPHIHTIVNAIQVG